MQQESSRYNHDSAKRPGVNLTIILWAAFFTFVHIRAAWKHVDEIDPRWGYGGLSETWDEVC